jgi:hypothetical protein
MLRAWPSPGFDDVVGNYPGLTIEDVRACIGFLANENVPRIAVEAVRVEGHDVTCIRIRGGSA